jgi:hypothetical protein
VVAAGTAVVVFGASGLLAQGTTGKIEGTVKDQSGAPIVGAQVLITGSAFSATTNEVGYYFLNNVPAGVVTVRAQYIGYAPNEVRNVRVLAGQTMTVNPVLEQRAIEVTGITVTVEQNPIVPRDQVTSKPIVQGDVIQALPVDAVSQVLRLQPGVVESNRGLSIRGSRPNETATYIDGVLVRNYGQQFLGQGSNNIVSVGTNALEEASVTSGATGAEFGEAAGGVISLVTRGGGSAFHGSVSYATDNVSGQVHGTGLNRVEASLGGPLIPNLTWFIGTTLQGQQNGLPNKGADANPKFVLNGIDTTMMVPLNPGARLTDSALVRLPKFRQFASGCADSAAFYGTCKSTRQPFNNSDSYTIDGKLQYTYGTGSRLSATVHRSRDQGLLGVAFDPIALRGNRSISNAYVVNWTQNLAASSERALFFEASFSWQRDQFVGGIVDPSWTQGHTNPFAFFTASNIKFLDDFSNFPVDDALIRNLRTNNCLGTRAGGAGNCVPFLNRNDLNTGSAYRTNPYAVTPGQAYYSFDGINSGGPTLSQETRKGGRANLDWQANRYNRIRAGGDYTDVDMLAFRSGLVNPIFMNAYHETPKKLGLYAQDRLDLGDVVIEFGLRYDRINSGVMYPRVPGRVYTDPFKSTALNLTQKLAQAYTAQDTAMATACNAAITANDSTALATCNYFKADPRSLISPSLRVSFPVTDRTGFRLSYSHQVQTPDFYQLARGTNTDLSFSNTNDIFARPLSFGKTILFEFGIRHAFSDDMVLDISAYNKDKVSDITARIEPIYDPFYGGPPNQTNQNINLMTNADFGNVRGLDVKLDRRIGSLFQGTVSYTYEQAKGTGSDPYEYLNTYSRQISAVTGERVPPPQALLTVADNRTHTIAGNLALNFPHGWNSGSALGSILQDAGLFATFRFASGLPYTRIVNVGTGARGPGNGFGLTATGLETLNSSFMPWIKNVDLRLTKGFRFGGKDLSIFADFRNLFNFTNYGGLFAETGDVHNAIFQGARISPVVAALQGDAGSLWVTKTVNGAPVTGVDLSDCSQYRWGPGGTKGPPDCFLLQRAEQRYGDGDKFFTTDEINRAFTAWYNTGNSPSSFYGAGFNLRLGFELTF